ncbi:hypothetical protein [Pectobacterium parvum]
MEKRQRRILFPGFLFPYVTPIFHLYFNRHRSPQSHGWSEATE